MNAKCQDVCHDHPPPASDVTAFYLHGPVVSYVTACMHPPPTYLPHCQCGFGQAEHHYTSPHFAFFHFITIIITLSLYTMNPFPPPSPPTPPSPAWRVNMPISPTGVCVCVCGCAALSRHKAASPPCTYLLLQAARCIASYYLHTLSPESRIRQLYTQVTYSWMRVMFSSLLVPHSCPCHPRPARVISLLGTPQVGAYISLRHVK